MDEINKEIGLDAVLESVIRGQDGRPQLEKASSGSDSDEKPGAREIEKA